MEVDDVDEFQPDTERGMSEDDQESNASEWMGEGKSKAAETSQVDGMKRDAWLRQKRPVLTEEQKVRVEQVRREVQKRSAWYEEDPTRWFGPEYHRCRQHGESSFLFVIRKLIPFCAGLNNWSDVFPNFLDMPAGWPGRDLDHGLRDEHLSPRC